MIHLTRGDWAEIYYALETKSRMLREARFGTELEAGQDPRWIAHLTRIMRKIGPDGKIAVRQGTSARPRMRPMPVTARCKTPQRAD